MATAPEQAPVEITREQAEILIRALEAARRRQRIMLLGYVLALVLMIGGMVLSLWVYGQLPRDTFRGWVFLAPPGIAGSILWIFGKWLGPARRRPK